MALMDDALIDKHELMKWMSRRNPDIPATDLAYLLDLPETVNAERDDEAFYGWD